MSRLFLALTPPDSHRKALSRLCPKGIPGLRTVPWNLVHLTLHFLGEADEERVIAAMQAVGFPDPFDLEIRGVGSFTARRQTTVLWAGVTDSAPLLSWHAVVGEALSDSGFRLREGAFQPHLTLARLSRARRAEKESTVDAITDFLETNADFRLPPWTVDSCDLYRSRNREGILHYETIRRFPR